MKALNLMVAVIFTVVLSLSPVPEIASADTTKGEVTAEKGIETVKTKKGSSKKKDALVTAIDINSADKELLTQLPGIGPVTAEAIVNYRTANGKFKTIEDVKNVKGIGNKTLAKLKPYLQKI